MLTYKADLSSPDDREALKTWVDDNFSDLDILFNDAGIQRWINLQNLKHDWSWYHQELAVNLEAQLHLTFLFLPQITAQPNGAFINISSGLVINNGAWVPVYTASKNGVHGFTQALRLQLQDTATKVFEILPPAVNTNLGGAGEHNYGNDLDEFADAVIQQLQDDLPEITFASSWDQLRLIKQPTKRRPRRPGICLRITRPLRTPNRCQPRRDADLKFGRRVVTIARRYLKGSRSADQGPW